MPNIKQTNELLKLTANQANAIVAIAEDAIISVDADQNIIMFNQGAERIFHYSMDEVLGKSLNLLLPENRRHHHANYVRDFGNSPQNSRLMAERREIEGRRKDGTLFPTEASICAIAEG